MVIDVESVLETGLLMQELYEKNLKDVFTWEEFERSVQRTKELEVLGTLYWRLPSSMRVFKNPYVNDVNKLRSNVVDDSSLECMLVGDLTNEWGVCAAIKGSFGNVYLVSMYCKPREIDTDYRAVSGIHNESKSKTELNDEYLIIGMHANADCCESNVAQ